MSGHSQYVTAEEIAAEQGVSVHTVRRYFRRAVDPLPGRKVGHGWRTTRGAYEAWLAGAGEAPRRRREDHSPLVQLEHIEVEAVDVDPPVFLLTLTGVVDGTDLPDGGVFAVTADGLAALTARCMAMSPVAPGFTESLMARLEADARPHVHDPEPV